MKKWFNILICLAAAIVLITSCGKKLVPALSAGKHSKVYDSATFDYVYVEAIKQKLMGNEGDALNYFEQCVKANPLNDASYYQMAQIVSANGDLNSAKKYLSEALALEPENIWYLMMMSSLYYQDKNIDSAIIYYEKAVKYYPEKENLQLTLGKLYAENNNNGKAIKIFEGLDKKEGINEISTILTVKSLIAERRYKEAEEKTLLLLKDNPDEIVYNGLLAEIYQGEGEKDRATEVYTKLIERNPDNPLIQVSLCDFLINSKRYDDLLRILDKVSLNKNISREDKLSLFARILEINEIAKSYGERLEDALIVLEDTYSKDDIIPLLRPELLVKMNKLQEAASRLKEIIKGKPENYYAWEKLLLVYLQQRDYIKLEKEGEECATKFNRSFLAKLLYATGAMENKNYSVALDELRKASILAGDDKGESLQVLTMKADIYYRMKDFSKTFETFDEAMKINSEDLTLINNYAYYLAEQNMRLKEAEKMSKKVIEKDRKNTAYLDTYGWILYKRGKLKAADKIMQEIISSGEAPDAEWYEHYGYILKKEKKCDKAVENWNIALKIDSSKIELKNEIKNCKSRH